MPKLALLEKTDKQSTPPKAAVVSLAPKIVAKNDQKLRDKQAAADILFNIRLFLDRSRPEN